jgi:hypothetical protein
VDAIIGAVETMHGIYSSITQKLYLKSYNRNANLATL